MEKQEPTTTTTLKVPKDAWAKFRAIAMMRGVTANSMLATMIEKSVKKNERMFIK